MHSPVKATRGSCLPHFSWKSLFFLVFLSLTGPTFLSLPVNAANPYENWGIPANGQVVKTLMELNSLMKSNQLSSPRVLSLWSSLKTATRLELPRCAFSETMEMLQNTWCGKAGIDELDVIRSTLTILDKTRTGTPKAFVRQLRRLQSLTSSSFFAPSDSWDFVRTTVEPTLLSPDGIMDRLATLRRKYSHVRAIDIIDGLLRTKIVSNVPALQISKYLNKTRDAYMVPQHRFEGLVKTWRYSSIARPERVEYENRLDTFLTSYFRSQKNPEDNVIKRNRLPDNFMNWIVLNFLSEETWLRLDLYPLLFRNWAATVVSISDDQLVDMVRLLLHEPRRKRISFVTAGCIFDSGWLGGRRCEQEEEGADEVCPALRDVENPNFKPPPGNPYLYNDPSQYKKL